MCELDLRFVDAIEESDRYSALHANTASTKPNSRNSHPSLCDSRKKTLSRASRKAEGSFLDEARRLLDVPSKSLLRLEAVHTEGRKKDSGPDSRKGSLRPVYGESLRS